MADGYFTRVWKSLLGTLDRDRFKEQVEEWPPSRCVRVHVVASDDDRRSASIIVDGFNVNVAFKILIENVAPFQIILTQHRLNVIVDELRAWNGQRDTCQWEMPDHQSLTGYLYIDPGGMEVIDLSKNWKPRVFALELTGEAGRLSVNGDLTVLGPWAEYEQRVSFSSSTWLPTELEENRQMLP